MFMMLFLVSGNSFASDRNRYESSDHKFRSQFNDNEWREHEARSERYFRARHPESYLYREDSYNHRHKRDNYRNNNSMRYGHEYEFDWQDDSHGYDWDEYDHDWQEDSDWDNGDEHEENSDDWDESR
jgi:hypothetical protein